MGSHLDRPPRTSKEDLKGRAVLGTQARVEFRSLVEPLGMERGRRRAGKMLLDCREHRFRPARVDAGTTRKVPHRVREVREAVLVLGHDRYPRRVESTNLVKKRHGRASAAVVEELPRQPP